MMQLSLKKGKDKKDYLSCTRNDGSQTRTWNPKIGMLPHDCVHFIVERNLDLDESFFKQINAGADLDFEAESNKETQTTEAYHTESLVECFQAVLANGTFEYEEFMYMYGVTCQARGIEPKSFTSADLGNFWQDLMEHNSIWMTVQIGETMELNWA